MSDNRAFRYGYGLFETMLVEDGTISLWNYHSQRLFHSIETLAIHIPKLLTPAMLHSEILKTVKKNKLEKLCRARLQVFAGNGGLYERDSINAGFVIECFPLEADIYKLNTSGLHLGIATGLYKSCDQLSNLKSSNALIYAMAAKQAQQNQWNDALILNTHGHIIESTIANIFWIKDQVVHTPLLTEGCVAGVMRRFILEKLTDKNIPIVESVFTNNALLGANNIFLTNAIRRIRWISSVEKNNYTQGIINDIYNAVFE